MFLTRNMGIFYRRRIIAERTRIGRDVGHTLLGETGTDDITRQVLQGVFVVGPDGRTTIHVEAAVMPLLESRRTIGGGEHVLNNRIRNFSLDREHL